MNVGACQFQSSLTELVKLCQAMLLDQKCILSVVEACSTSSAVLMSVSLDASQMPLLKSLGKLSHYLLHFDKISNEVIKDKEDYFDTVKLILAEINTVFHFTRVVLSSAVANDDLGVRTWQ